MAGDLTMKGVTKPVVLTRNTLVLIVPTSNPAGINCGATCAADFNFNQAVTLHGLIMILWFLSPLAIGLAKSPSPEGPWTDIGRPLLTGKPVNTTPPTASWVRLTRAPTRNASPRCTSATCST